MPAGQHLEQLASVDQVPVVTHRHGAPWPQPERWLGVLPARRAGRRVTAVGDRHLAAQGRQAALVEDLRDEAKVLVDHHLMAVADRQAGQFLAAMLQREEAERGEWRSLLCWRQDADDAAHGLGVRQQH